MSLAEHELVESGTLPGRYQWVEEPVPMGVPTDPDWNRFSDNMRQFTANAGSQVERNDGLGTADAVEHGRGSEEPEATIGYDLQRFPTDANGDPVGAEAYGMMRDEYNRIYATLLCVSRLEDSGGNFDAGVRQYTVVRGIAFDSVTGTLDPSETDPILVELESQPRKVRSYIIHQPDDPVMVTPTSTEPADDGIDVTIESEDAGMSETITMGGTTVDSFGDIDSIWLSDNPEGNVTVEADATGEVLIESTSAQTDSVLAGGLVYSDDTQPVDGDRGVPPLGAGSNAAPINEPYEYFIGDRVQRTVGTPYRPRINSLEWSFENSLEVDSLHQTRAPSVDAGNRNITLESDIAGARASHDSMMDALQKTSFPVGHELSGGVIEFPSLVIQEGGDREYEADDQAVAALSETLEATDGAAVEFHEGATLEDVLGE